MVQGTPTLSVYADPPAVLSVADMTAFDAWPATGAWSVLHTKSRQEKALGESLAAMGIPHFLPLITEVRYIGRRKVSVDRPLFPSYVFLKGSLEDSYRADRTKRVARVIPVTDQATLEWELRNIQVAMGHHVGLDPHPYLRQGVRVRVTAGPLRDLEGVVEQRLANLSRLVLQVQTLGRALSLEIDASLLEAV